MYSKNKNLIILTLTLLTSCVFQYQIDLFIFNEKIFPSQIWRLITAHYTHFDLVHLFWNLTALCLIAALWWDDFKTLDWALLLLAQPLLFIPWLVNSGWQNYAGMSGLLHGLFVYGLLRYGYRPVLIKWIMFAGLLGKLIYEQLGMAGLISGESWQVAVDAHLTGAIVGTLLALPWIMRETFSKNG